MAENLRLNQQNAVGNFFELLGQVILTFNAQQQLRQQGPGAYPSSKFNTEFAKIFSGESISSQASELHEEALQQSDVIAAISSGDGNSKSNGPNPKDNMEEISMLKQDIYELHKQIAQLREEIDCIKRNQEE